MSLPLLAARLFNTPLMIHPGKLQTIVAALGPRLLGLEEVTAEPLILAPTDPPVEFWSTSRRAPVAAEDDPEALAYTRHGPVAVVSMMGGLAHRTRIDGRSMRVLGYDRVAAALRQAADDPAVSSILLEVDSPGGEVAGAFELAELIHEITQHAKPVHAIADTMAASAAYLAASAARTLTITQTGYAGSIGVVMTHIESSKALDKAGHVVTHLYAGAHKIDGSPYLPLSDSARARFEGDIAELYDLFVDAVARYRTLTTAQVRDTQAATYRGPHAIAAGLADRVGTLDHLLHQLNNDSAALSRAALAASRPAAPRPLAVIRHEVSTMPLDPHAAHPAPPQPTPAAAFAAGPQITEADLKAAEDLGREAERTRILAILGHARVTAAATDPALHTALTLAADPNVSAELGHKLLDTLPAAAHPAHADHQFAQMMSALEPGQQVGLESQLTAEPDGWDRAYQATGA